MCCTCKLKHSKNIGNTKIKLTISSEKTVGKKITLKFKLKFSTFVV